jgi:hypothetical protein
MTDIPSDIQETARAAFASIASVDWIDAEIIIAHAILAERERCAQIAEAHHAYPIVRRDPDDIGGFTETVVGKGGIGPDIASRILTPSTLKATDK